MERIKQALYEKLAAIEHERWVDWQKYMHSKCVEHEDGKGEWVCLPADSFRHWERQINTKYEALSEKEKDSDREQVDRYWDLIEAMVKEVVEDIMAPMSYRITVHAKTREQLGEARWDTAMAKRGGYNDAIEKLKTRVGLYFTPEDDDGR